ncbi:MAG: UDP-N-acetylglucosamine--N-acetylmuramyl-(pentapeptide) pyrophosphoryl-undecaprenol N-acetylglucosamine transferase [Phycisphaerales bacterium]|nr:UDP-N-acetylglucosamine--N-acetylmuramyl-(pentapeptide) pyrophosphoryl-undecaprenol N-acetylglucosamine transferase [Phycisphaerales bacterium]
MSIGAPVFVFAGGGTGGHIYPALAVAERILEASPRARTRFLCSTRPLDADILRAESAPFTAIPAAPFVARPRALLKFALHWRAAVRASAAAISETLAGADPRSAWLACFGGFVCPPAAAAARRMGLSVAVVNLDAVPGKASRLLARRADAVFSPDGPTVPAAWRRIRPVVRRGAIPSATPGECRRRLGLDPDLDTLFVTGASQGARTINQMMGALLDRQAQALRGWQVFHQCGAGAEQHLTDAYERAGVPARVVPFCHAMADAWGAADLAVSRCGAGSVGEAWASATPTLFLPYPFHKDGHQRANALPLAQSGAAVIETDRIEASLNLPGPGAALLALLSDRPRREAMRGAFAALGPADGSFSVCSYLLGSGERSR